MIVLVILVRGYLLIQGIFSIFLIAAPFWLTYLSFKKGRFFGLGVVIISLIGQIVFWIISKGYLLFSFKENLFIDMKYADGISFDYTLYKYILLASLISIVVGLGSILLFNKTIKIRGFIIFIVSVITLGLYTNRRNHTEGMGHVIGLVLSTNNISTIETLGSSDFQQRLTTWSWSRTNQPSYYPTLKKTLEEYQQSKSPYYISNYEVYRARQGQRDLYTQDKNIYLGNFHTDLNNLQTAGKTYLKDEKYIYAKTYTYDTKSKTTTYKIEKLDLDINHVEFFLDGEWEYVKDNNKVYYLRGNLKMVTTLEGKDKNGTKQWRWDSYQITNTDLIDFIKSASSVYVKDLKKLNENYTTDGKKLYYTDKNRWEKEVKLGDYNINFKAISTLGKFYIKDTNNIYAVVRRKGLDYSAEYGITKLDLDMKDVKLLSGQHEYITYNKEKKIEYYEYIKDKNKVYYMKDMSNLWIVSSISKQIMNVPKPSLTGKRYPEGDTKLQFNLLNTNNTNTYSENIETSINKTILDFVSNVIPSPQQ